MVFYLCIYIYVCVISCYRIMWYWYTNHQVGMVVYYLRWCLYSVLILIKLIFTCGNPYLCKQYNAIWWVFLWLDSWTWCQFELILWELPKPPYVYPHLWSQIHQTSHGSNEPVSLLKPQSKVGRKKYILIRGALEKSTAHRDTSNAPRAHLQGQRLGKVRGSGPGEVWKLGPCVLYSMLYEHWRFACRNSQHLLFFWTIVVSHNRGFCW